MRIHAEANWRTGLVCGGLSGVFTGLFGVGGPLIALYYISAMEQKDDFAANMQGLFVIVFLINILARVKQGIFTVELLPMTAPGIVATNLGMIVGLWILDRPKGGTVRTMVCVFARLSGLLTISQHL